MKNKVFMVSLGCPKNQVDSEKTLYALQQAGMEIVADETQADIIITNTCGFVNDAKQESIDTILELSRLKKTNPDVKLAVMGCLSERYRDDLKKSIPEIDHIFGTAELSHIVSDLAPKKIEAPHDPDDSARILTTAPHWAYLKIAEGCSNKCAFCIIPAIRGPYKSVPADMALKEAKALAARGVKELILVAQDTTLYGADIHMKNGLAELLRGLVKIPGLEWIRVMYMYPTLVNDELLSVMAGEEKVAPYFDMPLQHAADSVLKNMLRPETNGSIRALLEKIKRRLPHAALRTAFITGFPGETEADFKVLLNLVKDEEFDHMGAFVYSPEEGTSAYGMPGSVPRKKAEERYARLMETQKSISSRKLERKVGMTGRVLVDGMAGEEMLNTGRLITQSPGIDGCVILDGVEAEPGDFIQVAITGHTEYDLIGSGAENV
ncbi:MAG: 30S ribosomal protein S12 methylthiotransferase RimO [Nitrospinae bacterium]|nr:30S ribosomal protein S12 methylthiotransferase RimO [Nitrospinota bacterium]